MPIRQMRRKAYCGNWDWDFKKSGVFIGVSVVAPTVDDTQLQEIDALIDDGDLSQDWFVKARPNRYSAILE